MKYLIPLLFGALAACASPASFHAGEGQDDAVHRVYDASRDAEADVDAALAKVAGTDRMVIVSLGANWCHDSRGLSEHFANPEIAPIIAGSYEVVWVDVGSPQTGKPRNVALSERLGVAPIVGTPTVVVMSADGEVLNADDAGSWRNAHSRSTDEVRDYFAELAKRGEGG